VVFADVPGAADRGGREREDALFRLLGRGATERPPGPPPILTKRTCKDAVFSRSRSAERVFAEVWGTPILLMHFLAPWTLSGATERAPGPPFLSFGRKSWILFENAPSSTFLGELAAERPPGPPVALPKVDPVNF
jgi:hypothetical protein